MRREVFQDLGSILSSQPQAYAFVYGSEEYPDINGAVFFYSMWGGSILVVDVSGLPTSDKPCAGRIFGFHIHEGSECTGTKEDPFANTKTHYNPGECSHPEHAGDLPPLFENRGDAFCVFYTDRFYPEEVVDRTVVIHDMPDDFTSQPAGNAGMKIACGMIVDNSSM